MPKALCQKISASIRAGYRRCFRTICRMRASPHRSSFCPNLPKLPFFLRCPHARLFYPDFSIPGFHTKGPPLHCRPVRFWDKGNHFCLLYKFQAPKKTNGILHRELLQNWPGKFRMCAPVGIQRHCQIGQITFSVSCGADFFTRFFILFQNGDRCTGSGCKNTGCQPDAPPPIIRTLLFSISFLLSFTFLQRCIYGSATIPASASFCKDIRIPNFACSQVKPP